MLDSGITRTADYWDRYVKMAVNRGEWQAHPLVQERFLRQRGGLSLEEWFISTYCSGRRFRRGMSVGAGVASFEVNLLQRGIVEAFDLYDVSQASLDVATQRARALGLDGRVRCFCADVTEVQWEEQYDLVTFISSLHHVTNLDQLLNQIHALLDEDGLVFAVEYVGPDRFAFPERDTDVARTLYRVLDPQLRSPWPELPLPHVPDVIAADPTEAVHSSAIIETLQDIFEYCEITPLQTSLAYIMWPGLNHDMLYESEQGMDLVRMILEVDQLLVDTGKMPNYFAYLAASKKGFR
jgi:SAM-dependent methyltransferase